MLVLLIGKGRAGVLAEDAGRVSDLLVDAGVADAVVFGRMPVPSLMVMGRIRIYVLLVGSIVGTFSKIVPEKLNQSVHSPPEPPGKADLSYFGLRTGAWPVIVRSVSKPYWGVAKR